VQGRKLSGTRIAALKNRQLEASERFAGAITLLSAVLVWLSSPWWLLHTAFVGVNMTQASITGICPAAMLFKALRTKPGVAFP
jgi:hypothetical protein